ncbi:MAG: ubiquitin-activating E1 FCCH domain-containing protein [Alphaproteobacteria bacterium]
MAKSAAIISTFTAGEVTERLDGRTDLAKYKDSLKTLENGIVLPHGGIKSRGGFHFVAEAKSSSAKIRLVAFEFSVTQPYIIEFGNLYIRFYRNNGQIQSGGSAVEVATPYLTADLPDLHFAQSADTLYIAHKSYAPRKLTRSSHTSWTLTTISFTGTTFPSTFCGGSAGTGTDGNDKNPGAVTFFNQRLFWGGSNDDPQKIWGSEVANFESMDQGSAGADNSVEFTLVANQVNAIQWLAESTDMLCGTLGGEFTITGGQDDNITPTNIKAVRQAGFGSNKVAPLNVGNLLLFNQRAGRKVRELVFNFDVDGYLAPDITLLAEHVTESGVVDMAYQQEEDTIVWACTDDGELIGCTYLRDQNVVAWHRHPVGGDLPVVESVAVIPSADGLRDELWISVKKRINGVTKRFIEWLNPNVFADSSLTLDNPITITGATQANPVVVTAASHGFSNGDFVDIKEVKGMTELNGIRYKVANQTTNTFELTDQNTGANINGTAFSAYDSAGKVRKGVTTITGLDHLNGETVKIVGNGAVFPDKTVSGGSVTVSSPVSEAYVGQGFTGVIKPSRPEFGTPTGTSQGRKKRANQVLVRLVNTTGIKINGDQIPFRSSADLMGSPPAEFTGDKKVMNLGYDRDGFVEIRQEQPLDFHVVAIIMDMNVGEHF